MPGLNFAIGANTSAFESGMSRVRDIAAKRAADMVTNFQSAAKGIDTAFAGLTTLQSLPSTLAAIGTAARLAAVGFIAFEAISFAISETGKAAEAARQKLDELVKIGLEARNLGVSGSFLQGLTGQAKDLGIEASTVASALAKARDAATPRIGEGKDGRSTSPIEDRIQQNVNAGNLPASSLGQYGAADSQEARIRVVIGLIEQLQAKNASLAAFDLAGKFFGSDFEQKLRSGVDIIGSMKTALDGVTAAGGSRVFTDEELQRAQSIKDQIAEIENRMATGLAPIQRDILLYQQQQLQAWVDIKSQVADAIIFVAGLYDKVKAVGDYLGSLGSSDIFKSLRDTLNSVGLIDKAEVDRLNKQLNGGIAVDENGNDKNPPLAVKVRPRDTSRNLPSLSTPKAASPSSAESIDQIQTFINGLDKQTAALKAQVEFFDKSTAQQQVAINLAKAQEIASQNGKTLTDAQTAAITAQSTAYGNATDALTRLNAAQNQAGASARYFADTLSNGFADAIVDGKGLVGILSGIERQLARSAIQGLIGGTGPFASIFGTAGDPTAKGVDAAGGIFGSLIRGFSGLKFNAAGGPVQSGDWSVVGEQGPELVRFGRNGVVMPSIPTSGGTSAGTQIRMGDTIIDARGADAGVEQRIYATFASVLAEQKRTLLRTIDERQKRA